VKPPVELEYALEMTTKGVDVFGAHGRITVGFIGGQAHNLANFHTWEYLIFISGIISCFTSEPDCA
jgi:hypothetical protein